MHQNGGRSTSLLWMVRMSVCIGWSGHGGPQVEGEFLTVIGQEGYMTRPVRILNNKHNLRVSLRSDSVGMLRVSRSVA